MQGPRNILSLIPIQGMMKGYFIGHYTNSFGVAIAELASLIAQGKIHYKESIYKGIDKSVDAINSLFGSANDGKAMVQVSEETK